MRIFLSGGNSLKNINLNEEKYEIQKDFKKHSTNIKYIKDFIAEQGYENEYLEEQLRNSVVALRITEIVPVNEDGIIQNKVITVATGIINTNDNNSAFKLRERLKKITSQTEIPEPKIIHMLEMSNIVVNRALRNVGHSKQVLEILMDITKDKNVLIIASNKNSKNAKYAQKLIDHMKKSPKRRITKLGTCELYKFNKSFIYTLSKYDYSTQKFYV